jgi:hypothetical protein
MGVKPLRSRGQPLTLEELETVYRRDGAAFERVAIAIVGDEQLGCDAVHDADKSRGNSARPFDAASLSRAGR